MAPLILIADDERAIANALVTLLEDEGYAVRVARDGRGALQQILAASPDLVLSDVNMPGLSGVSLVRHLRAIGDPTPVILMSAVDHPADVPGVPFVAKPFDIDELINLVRRVLDEATGSGLDVS